MERGYEYFKRVDEKELPPLPLGKFIEEVRKDWPPVKDKDTWGKWKLRFGSLVFDGGHGDEFYVIRLEDITENTFLGWVNHLFDKTWITPVDLWNFIWATRECKPKLNHD
jgi:hypothetical protein